MWKFKRSSVGAFRGINGTKNDSYRHRLGGIYFVLTVEDIGECFSQILISARKYLSTSLTAAKHLLAAVKDYFLVARQREYAVIFQHDYALDCSFVSDLIARLHYLFGFVLCYLGTVVILGYKLSYSLVSFV